MGLQDVPGEFWAFATPVTLALLGGFGWLVRFLLSRKAEAEKEADESTEREVSRARESAECKAKIIYLEAASADLKERFAECRAEKRDLEERCERLDWELRHRPPS